MGVTSRVSLPQEFYDKTSDQLLVQPLPQFLYAQLFMGALAASLQIPSAMGLAGREVSSIGAQYSNFEKDQLRLAQPLMRELIAAEVNFSAAPGNTIRINRPAYIAGASYTELSRRINTGATISTTPIAVQSEQTNLTLFRYGGPYDPTNTRVAPLAIEAFDANMGVHKLTQIVGNQLVKDMHQFIDTVQVQLLDLASSTVYPDSMSADNDATAKGSFNFTYEQLIRAERTANDASLPTMSDGFRVAVLTPTQVAQLGLDPAYQRLSAFHPMYNQLFGANYISSVSKTHIFQSSTLSAVSNGSSVKIHRGHYIAPGALLAGMGRRPEVRSSTDDNFGETAKVAWIGDFAFGLADNRFCISLRSTEDA